MGAQSLPMLVGLVNTSSCLLVCEVAVLCCKGLCYLFDHQLPALPAGLGHGFTTHFFSRHAQLDIVHPNIHMMSDDLTHLIWPICSRRDSGNERPVPPSKLLSVSQVTWPWNVPCVYRIPDDHVQAVLCGRCTKAPVTRWSACLILDESNNDKRPTLCSQNQENILRSSS